MKLFISSFATAIILASTGFASASTHPYQDRSVRSAASVLEFTGQVRIPLTSNDRGTAYGFGDNDYRGTATGGPVGGLIGNGG